MDVTDSVSAPMGVDAAENLRAHCLSQNNCAATKPGRHCNACTLARINSDPEVKARRAAAIRAKHADPEFRKAHAARARRQFEKAWADPAYRERRREHGRRQHRECLTRPDVIAKNQSPEVRKAAGRKRTDRVLAWCPPSYRDQYRVLIRSKLMTASEARKAIEEQIRADGRREVARNAAAMREKHQRDLASRY